MILKSVVCKGDGIGRLIGFPTINLEVEKSLINFDYGVYNCLVFLPNEESRKGAMYFGPRYTLKDKEPRLEVHILDFEGDLLGTEVKIEVGEQIRAGQKFKDRDDLKSQIKKDVEKCR